MSNGSARVLWRSATGRSAEAEFLRKPDGCLVDGCNRLAHPGLERVVLCDHHIERLMSELSNYQAEVPYTPVERASFIAARREAREIPPNHVVYYIRFAEHIKIGTTGALPKRFSGFCVHPDTLLAVEPGDSVTERQRHFMFKAERVKQKVGRNRELFDPSPRLLEHIEHVRSLFGDPKNFLSDAAPHLAG